MLILFQMIQDIEVHVLLKKTQRYVEIECFYMLTHVFIYIKI